MLPIVIIKYSGYVYGNTPLKNDLSHIKDYSLFMKKINYCLSKQFASLEKGGRLIILTINIKYYNKIIDRYIETCLSNEEIFKCGAFINNKKLYLSPTDRDLDTSKYNDFELFNNLFNKYKTHQISLCELKNDIKKSLHSLLYYYNTRQDNVSSIISSLKHIPGKIYTYDVFVEEIRETIDFCIGIFEW
uniref:hypothetical protein n=2 Tax=unclassified Clostridioides TaxID=2635829 RepID=UPI001E648063|nr:hypothetical protein [Clostridioides sp. ES-S-0107-01]